MGETIKKIDVAIVGLGAIGKRHLDLVKANPAFRLVGAAARSEATRSLAEGSGAKFHTDYRRMIVETRPEAVIDASPTEERVDVVLECAKAGAHALIEKPVAATLAGGKRIVEAVRASGIRVLVGHHRRHNPLARAAKALLENGTLGDIRLVVAMWTALKPDHYYDIAWRRGIGGGPLITNLVHEADTLRFFCGEVESVRAVTSNRVRSMVNCDTAAAILTFRSGAVANLTMSDVVTSPWVYELTSGEDPGFPANDQNHLLLMGSEASLAFPRMELWRHPLGRKQGWRGPFERSKIDVPPEDPLAVQLRHFADVVRGRCPAISNAISGLRSLALTLAIAEAGKNDAPVRPDDLLA